MNHIITQYTDRLAVIFIVLVIGVSVVFGIMPFVDALHEARRAIEEEHIAQDVHIQSTVHKERIRQEQKIIAENFALLPIVPTQTQIIALIELLEQMADERAITVRFAARTDDQIAIIKQKIRAKAKTLTENTEETEIVAKVTHTGPEKYFTVTLIGAFKDVTGFISIMENAPYYIFIDAVTIVPQRQMHKTAPRAGVVLVAPTDTETYKSSEIDDAKYVIATIDARIPFDDNKKVQTMP